MMTLDVGTKLGRYEILSPIGAGGMGEVYLAEDVRLQRKVALKILPENIATDKERLHRFEQEARAASALNHPNILTVYEFGFETDIHFLATELIEGETLREIMSGGELSLSETLNIAEQTAFALSAAHAAGIVHRDLKPENIMIRRDGIVKVLDFGLAKLTEKKAVESGSEAETRALVQTKAGVVMGTVGYMSPEQAKGKDTDERTDIWSLGVVLYEMICSELPFTGETANDVIASILKSEPMPLSHYVSDVPKELKRIIGKTLRKNREERYQHIKDLWLDLKDIKQDLEFQNKLERTAAPNREESKTQIFNATTTDVTHTTSSAEYIASEIKQHKSGSIAALSILLLSLVGLGYWFFAGRSVNTKQIESIAVMPFVNESGNADTEYLSDGMTETLISSLSQLPNLLVKARSSVFRYKGKETDPQQIGKELNVQSVLNGRVVQRGQGLTLYIELVDTATEKVLWSENYNRKTTDLISLQSEIARDASQKLRTRLSGADEQRITKNYTQNPEAYQLYLKGRYYLHQFSVDSYDKAIEHFNKAIEIDPAYALAYVGLADAYAEASSASLPPAEAMPKARRAAQKALEIDETLAEAHVSMALVIWWHDWNPSDAEREFKRSIELNPNYSLAHLYYGEFLSQQERFNESIVEFKRAQELDPLSSDINSSMVRPYFFMRQYDRMIELAKKSIELDQHHPSAHSNLGQAYEQKGMYEQAIAEFEKAIELGGRLPHLIVGLGRAYAKSGKNGEALKILEELEQPSRRIYASPVRIASIYAALGDKEQAFRWLEKAYQDRTDHLLWLRIDPALDSLRSDPRFQDLMRRVGLPQ